MTLWGNPYQAKTFNGDLFGGLTAGIVALPLALAFGVASGAGAAAGLYGAILLGFFASVFGGTKTQISGPTGPMTVVVAASATTLGGDWTLVMASIILAGIIQIGIGLSGLGKLVKYIPYPVISGFMSGIGIIIILLQIPILLGHESLSSPLKSFLAIPDALITLNVNSLLLGIASLVILFFTPKKITHYFPAPLLALLLITPIAYYGQMDVTLIGAIPMELPELMIPLTEIDKMVLIIPTAITLALLGSIDTLLTSLVADSLTRTKHNSKIELIGQGTGNALAGLFGGLPGAGATMRTVVNIKSGGTTPLSGIIHALLLLILLLGAAPLAEIIPLPVLAGILVKVGVDILDYRILRIIRSVPKHDLYVMLTVLGLTVFVDLIMAVGVGITLASVLLTMRIANQTGIKTSIPAPDTEELAANVQNETRNQIRIVNIEGAFFFGSTSQIVEHVDKAIGTKVLIFNCKSVPFFDLSAIFALEEMVHKLHDSGVSVIMVVNEQGRQKLSRYPIWDLIGEDAVFTSEIPAIVLARSKVG